jgi:nucleotide-binding universal stress UspA family protein
VTVTRGDEGPPSSPAAGRDTGNGRRPLLVVGVDGTPAGDAALRWTTEQSLLSGARVLAIAVSEPQPLVAGGPELAAGAMAQGMLDAEQLAAAAEAWLAQAVAALPVEAQATVEGRVVHGEAATVLLEAAHDADLLVLGNHGRGALAGAIAGSVAQRCAHHAACPLVLVPAPDTSAGGR